MMVMVMVGGLKPPPGEPFKTVNREDLEIMIHVDCCQCMPWKVLSETDRQAREHLLY